MPVLRKRSTKCWCPTEEVIEVRRGKKVTSERRFMPGYVLVHMEMSNRGYHLISSINRVTGFLGPQGKPMPMRDAEVNAILNRVEEGLEAPRNLIRFDIGETVQGDRRPVRGLFGHGRGCGRGAQPPEGLRVDLRPGDARGTGIHSGLERELRNRVGGERRLNQVTDRTTKPHHPIPGGRSDKGEARWPRRLSAASSCK